MEINGNALLGGRRQARRASRAGPGGSAKATRERFTPQYKLSLVERADACETPGEIGRLPRREGLYSSHLSARWKAVRVDLGIRRSTFYGWFRTGVWRDWPTGIPAPACAGTGFPTRFVSASSTRRMRCEGKRHDR